MAAGQVAAGTRQSSLLLKVTPASQDDREFMLWHQSMVAAALGTEVTGEQGEHKGAVGQRQGGMGGGEHEVTAQALSQISQLLTRQQNSLEGATKGEECERPPSILEASADLKKPG